MTSCRVTIKKAEIRRRKLIFERTDCQRLSRLLQPASHPVPPVPADWAASPVAPISPCWALTAASAWRPALPAPTRPPTRAAAVSITGYAVRNGEKLLFLIGKVRISSKICPELMKPLQNSRRELPALATA